MQRKKKKLRAFGPEMCYVENRAVAAVCDSPFTETFSPSLELLNYYQ
jgi:hypothetical protein